MIHGNYSCGVLLVISTSQDLLAPDDLPCNSNGGSRDLNSSNCTLAIVVTTNDAVLHSKTCTA